MSPEITINKMDNIANIKMVGETSLDDILQTLDKLSDGKKFLYNRRLYDLRDCNFNLTNKELNQIAAHSDKLSTGDSKTAYVTGNDLVYGQLRVHIAYEDSEGHKSDVFRTMEEAVIWIQS